MNIKSIALENNTPVPNQKTRSTAATTNSTVKLELVSAQDWDRSCGEFSDIIPEQTGTFNEGHWGAENIECATFIHQGKLVGGCVVVVRKIPFSNTGIAVVKWGPVFHKRDNQNHQNIQKSIIAELTNEYCDRRGLHLTIMPPASPENSENICGMLTEAGFSEGSSLAAPERYLVATHQDTETLMASFNQKWRYNLRKALKNEFEIYFANNTEGLETFMDLYAKMMARKGFLDASAISSLEQFFNNSPENSRPSIILVKHDGQVTAGGIFFTLGETASYMFGATDDRAVRLKAGYALHWWLCEYLCNQDHINWYDLGGNDLDAGLHQFKKGMVGKSGRILEAPPRYHYASRPMARIVGNAIFQGRDAFAALKRTSHKLRKWSRN